MNKEKPQIGITIPLIVLAFFIGYVITKATRTTTTQPTTQERNLEQEVTDLTQRMIVVENKLRKLTPSTKLTTPTTTPTTIPTTKPATKPTTQP